MSNIRAILQDSVTILDPGTKNTRSGNATQDWDSPVNRGVQPASVQGLTSTEEQGPRDGARARYRVYLSPDAPATQSSRLTWGTKTLEVVGTPRIVFQLISASPHHMEITAKEVLG